MDEKSLQIARMNSITQSREWLSCRTNCNFSAREWLRTASLITDYIIEGESDNVKSRIKKLDEFIDKQNESRKRD